MKNRLENKTIIVTGSARGIGRACALQCAKNGANVIVNGRSESDALAQTVATREDVERLVQAAINRFGSIQGLVNNAGIGPFVEFLEMDDEIWDSTMAINVKGLFLTTQIVARAMVKQGHGGRICNVTSISGEKATNPLQVPYCTSKGAANMFTKISALALSKHNITVNAILPGTIETDINRDILNSDNVRQSIEDATPLGCLGETDDVAHAVVYFMSDESKWVTGALLPIDGGFIA